jgi:hypothetical protein
MKVTHKAKSFVSYLLQFAKPLAMPVHYHIESTNRCNLRCSFCPYSVIDPKSIGYGDIDVGFFEKLLCQIAQNPPPHGVSLHLAGEPLLHPKIDSLVAATHRILKITPMFATNGVLLDDSTAKKLSDAGGAELIIDFCANVTTFETYRVGAKWKTVLDNIDRTLECYPNIHISLRALDNDIDSLNALFGKYSNCDVSGFVLHNTGGEFAQKIEEKFALGVKREKYYGCTHPWFGFAITFDGLAVICCRDVLHKHVVGDLKTNTVRQIWLGVEYRRIRKLLSSKKISQLPMCATCSRVWDIENSATSILKRYTKSKFS